MTRTTAISFTSAVRWVRKDELEFLEGDLRVDIMSTPQ